MKRILFLSLLNFIVGTGLLMQAEAAERMNFYSGVRCLGMGGACIAVVNDETALVVNPAALGKLRDVYGTIFDPEIEGNYHLPDFYTKEAFSNPFELENVKASLDKKREHYYHSKAQIFPSFVARNFGVGLLGNYTLNAEMSNDGTTIDTNYRSDLAFILGFNFRLWDGRIKLGFNTRLISRVEVQNSAVSAAGSLAYKDIGSEGVGLGTDIGLILAAPWEYLPTVSAVLRDVGGTSFDKASGVRLSTTNRPNIVKQDLDVAVALFPIHTNNVRSAWTIEYRGLLTAEDETDKAKLLHAGFEMNFGDVFFFRGGYNQRYWTSGFEISSERTQWQFATYGEEVGTSANPREDRRYTIKFAYRF
jgi:hypothetical protein